MTIKELHTGIDVALKVYNRDMLNRFLPEEKDYILNKVIINLIHKTAEDARHSILNTESYADITAFYNVLEPFLITKTLVNPINRGRYNEYNLPHYPIVLSVAGSIVMREVQYKVEEVGNINSMTLNSNQGTLVEDDIVYLQPRYEIFSETDALGVYALTLTAGVTYEIIRVDSIDFTPCGAINNDIGTVFLCTEDSSWSSDDDPLPATKLRILSHTPATWTNVRLVALKNFNLFDYISINTLIGTNRRITPSNRLHLTKGSYYKVIANGEFVDITDFGAEWNIVEKGYIFVATKNGSPEWATNSTAVLEILTNSPCRVIKPQDIGTLLEHSYGSTASSPMVTFGDGKIQVYHDSKYSIARVNLTYVRPPITIDNITNLESDVNLNLHPLLVDLAIQDILSTNNPALFQAVTAKTMQQQQPK